MTTKHHIIGVQVGRDLFIKNNALNFIRKHQANKVRIGHRLRNCNRFETVSNGLFKTGAGPLSDFHSAGCIAQIQGMGTPLGSVAHHRDASIPD